MSIGAEQLLREHDTRLNIAIAWIEGRLDSYDEDIAMNHGLVDETVVAVARARMDLGLYTPKTNQKGK